MDCLSPHGVHMVQIEDRIELGEVGGRQGGLEGRREGGKWGERQTDTGRERSPY